MRIHLFWTLMLVAFVAAADRPSREQIEFAKLLTELDGKPTDSVPGFVVANKEKLASLMGPDYTTWSRLTRVLIKKGVLRMGQNEKMCQALWAVYARQVEAGAKSRAAKPTQAAQFLADSVFYDDNRRQLGLTVVLSNLTGKKATQTERLSDVLAFLLGDANEIPRLKDCLQPEIMLDLTILRSEIEHVMVKLDHKAAGPITRDLIPGHRDGHIVYSTTAAQTTHFLTLLKQLGTLELGNKASEYPAFQPLAGELRTFLSRRLAETKDKRYWVNKVSVAADKIERPTGLPLSLTTTALRLLQNKAMWVEPPDQEIVDDVLHLVADHPKPKEVTQPLLQYICYRIRTQRVAGSLSLLKEMDRTLLMSQARRLSVPVLSAYEQDKIPAKHAAWLLSLSMPEEAFFAWLDKRQTKQTARRFAALRNAHKLLSAKNEID